MGRIVLLATVSAAPVFGQTANDGFDPNANGPVRAIAVQADGRIIIGGGFTTVGGLSRTNLARLNPDGTVDTNFMASALLSWCGSCEDVVWGIALQADAKILVAGGFNQVNGQPRTGLARLYPDGTLDTNLDLALAGEVHALLVLPDGKIMVGGKFATTGALGRQGMLRLGSDGSVDDLSIFGDNSVVEALALQADGKVLVGGYFSAMSGLPRANIGRLNSDGTVDSAFDPGASGQVVYTLAVQADGRVLVGGNFNTLGGQARVDIGRLNWDGTLDTSFNPGAAN